ncbi:MAG TPA: hypothetical protein VFU15_06130 [Bacteroidia bacterium]|nr:hypothetical protein [Bacteroidia bacterium]
MDPKRSLGVIFLLQFAFSLKAGNFESRYGIGVVHVEPYNFFSIQFWKKPSDVIPYEQVNFLRDSSGKFLHFYFSDADTDSAPAWFAPEIFTMKSDTPRIDMFCIEQSGDWCNVIVNSGTGKSMWIHTGPDTKFRTWEEFYAEFSMITLTDAEAQIYPKPDLKAKHKKVTAKLSPGQAQKILPGAIQDRWMNVTVIVTGPDGKEVSKTTGWILWRDDDKPLVNYTR